MTVATPSSSEKSKFCQLSVNAGRGAERAHAWMPPPSSTSVCPLIAAASGDGEEVDCERHLVGLEQAAERRHLLERGLRPPRPSARSSRRCSRSCGASCPCRRTPGRPHSRSRRFRRPRRPLRASARSRRAWTRRTQRCSGTPMSPATEATVTMRPSPRSIMPPTTARVQRNAPVAFTSRCARQSSSVVRAAARSEATPALLTSTSTRPRRSKNVSTICSSVTSSRRGRPLRRGLARAANRSATAFPMPFVPPVTTTRRLTRSAFRSSFPEGVLRQVVHEAGPRAGTCAARVARATKSLSSCSSSGSLATT